MRVLPVEESADTRDDESAQAVRLPMRCAPTQTSRGGSTRLQLDPTGTLLSVFLLITAVSVVPSVVRINTSGSTSVPSTEPARSVRDDRVDRGATFEWARIRQAVRREPNVRSSAPINLFATQRSDSRLRIGPCSHC
ncbi:hypothetical protein CH273_23800 [Rhodococcus sp. 05-339-2]|nr:hypothetical protein CH273_23800 [Rhodococcus sp. 05-339-2]